MAAFDLTDLGLFVLLLAIYIYLIATLNNITTLYKSYLFFHFSMMLWPLANFLTHVTGNVELQWFFVLAGFYALASLSFGWLMFSLVLTRQFQGFHRISTYMWALPALIGIILMTTNPWHLLFAQPVDGQWVVRTYGPFFWVFIASSMFYVFASIVYILRATERTAEKGLRRQLQLCLLGLVLVVFFSILDLLINVVFYPAFGVVPGLTSLGIFLSAICFVIAIQRYDLFNIITIARQEVVDSMLTAMIVVDNNDVVLDLNDSAAKYIRLRAGKAVDIKGSMVRYASCGSGNSLDCLSIIPGNRGHGGRIIIKEERESDIVVNISPVLDSRRKCLGRVVTFNDVTHLRSLIEEVKEKNAILHRQNGELLSVQKELSEVNKKLSDMAITDDLTGCYNKRFLFEYLINEINVARRYKKSFTLMVLDLDEFKKINDTYGHLAGDEVLREVAKLIKENLRQSDIISRFGGEEFIVYCPMCGRSQGLSLAQKIGDMIRMHPFWAGGCCLHVTTSIGLVCYSPEDGGKGPAEELLDSLLKRADNALYRAKDLGRDQIIMAGWNAGLPLGF